MVFLQAYVDAVLQRSQRQKKKKEKVGSINSVFVWNFDLFFFHCRVFVFILNVLKYCMKTV